VPQLVNPAWDNASQLSLPSIAAASSLASPLKPNDLGVPTSPEGRVLIPINEIAIDDGYNLNSLCTPWEGIEPIELDGPDQEEDPLPFGSAPLAAVETPAEFDTEKIVTLDELRKLKVADLREQLKSCGVYSACKKEELVMRLSHCLKNNIPVLENMTAAKAANMAGDCFSPGAHWEPVVCNGNSSKNPYIYVAIISSGLCSESHENSALPLPPNCFTSTPSEKYLILNSFLNIHFQNAHNIK
jgi:hypothetical protein